MHREGGSVAIEGGEARKADGARHELFAGARRTRDQGREVAETIVEAAPISAHVLREHRIPDLGTQPGDRKRRAIETPEDEVESSADLEEERQQQVGRDLLRESQLARQQSLVGTFERLPERDPQGGVAFNGQLHEIGLPAVVERVPGHVAIEPQLALRDIAPLQQLVEPRRDLLLQDRLQP